MTLSELAFRHRPLVALVLLALMAFGARSYFTLPTREDPRITIREAVITTEFPGLSAERIERLITRPLEEAVRRVPAIEEIRSISMPGVSIIHAETYPHLFALDQVWDELRDKVSRARGRLPEGTRTPWVNTDFGDVAVVTVALLAEDFSWPERFDIAEHVRDRLYAVPGTKRVDLFGEQPERIFVEIANARLAELGLDPRQLAAALREQNVIATGGVVDSGASAILLEPSGSFDGLGAVGETLVRLPDGRGSIALQDLAELRRATIDPPQRPVYFNGQPVIVLAVSMHDGVSALHHGRAVRAALERIEAGLPVGYRLEVMTYQAEQVAKAVYGVTVSVLQTLAIVLLVVIFFLGLRTGLIVGAIVPAAMLITLAVMGMLEMSLQRMSLATLVIALGLLVDNGIVIAEDFKRRLEEGCGRDQALREGGRELALPLLVSTLITILVFLPLMLAEHTAGEYTRSISQVILIALLSSWVLAMTVTPTLCHRFIAVGEARSLPDRVFAWLAAIYGRLLRRVLRHRIWLLAIMLGLLAVAVVGIAQAPKRFFPNSDRAQVLVYIDLPAGVTTCTTDAAMRRILAVLEQSPGIPNVVSHATYVGHGGPRFVLSLTPIDPAPNVAFMVVNVAGMAHLDQVVHDLRALFRTQAPELAARVSEMFLGPSDSTRLEVRVRGPDPAVLRAAGQRLERALADLPGAIDIHSDWYNRIPKVVVAIDQARARRAGVSSAEIAEALARVLDGQPVTALRETDESVPILVRAPRAERIDLGQLGALEIFARERATSVPLAQLADLELTSAQGRIVRVDMMRTLTVSARNTRLTAEDMVPLIAPALTAIASELPPGHWVDFDGVVVDSGESRAALAANVPLALAVILVLLVGQFNGYRRPLIILATIPLVLIGASAGLWAMGASFGFMVILGLFSLSGIITINAIVLIERIDIERAAAADPHEAIVVAATRRLRPILMTTITTILGLMPLILTQDPLFHGMASVIAFGLLVGTLLTLGVVPVLYSLLVVGRLGAGAGLSRARSERGGVGAGTARIRSAPHGRSMSCDPGRGKA
ncbi:efflux RND transporter permease subunit [Marichromatium bheemlicum]|uniref:Efflux RND transporter permease subunit n=1 Tax=Marichromatium bheemlicum TaxID=365339 RepID=A0ABX1I388_9GAMM|nr:efflux RND transporter permease subunit [Marichromatium bheemlicum]NKN31895.1 efflux RND transporter permease subunit [Marichromatium bheemlicum]